MQTHDQQVAEFTAHVRRLCSHMSAAYLKTVFDAVELGLVSSAHTENIVAVSLLQGLRGLHVGSALKVVKDVREELSPAIRSTGITIKGIRTVGRVPVKGADAWNAWVNRKQAENQIRPAPTPEPTRMFEVLKKAEQIMAKNIYPRPDVSADHPYAVLVQVREVIAAAEGGAA